MRRSAWLVAAVAAVLLVLVASGAGATTRAKQPVTLQGAVSSVADGDTIKVIARGFETPVRLIGIDTPETRHPTKPVQCYGPKASAMTKQLLPVGQKVRLVTDPTQDTRDRYARLLAYVFKPGRSGAQGSINYTLVNTGRAKVYVYGGVRFQYTDAFFRSQAKAKKAKRGLWGPPCNGNTTKADPSVVRAPAPTVPVVPTPPPATPAPAPAPTPAPTGPCDPNYTGACIPPYPPDLDCGEITARNFQSIGSDPHNFDVDHDGIACEE